MRRPPLQRTLDQVRRTVLHLLSLRGLRDAWMYVVRIVERMEDNHIFLSAAAIAFNSLLCFIPLLLIISYFLGFYLGSESAITTIDRWLDTLEMFPYEKYQLRETILGLLREFVGASSIAGLIGILGLIWTSSALFAALRTVLNRIYHVKDTKSIVVSKLKDLALLSIIGIALIVMTVLVYGMTIVRAVAEDLLGLPMDHWMLQSTVLHGTTFVITFLVFCVIFLLVPDKRLPMRAIMLTSGLATLLWAIAKVVFSYYLTNLWSIGRVYGPYAIIVATAIWVYYSSITLLLAAEVGEMYVERRKLKGLFKDTGMRSLLASIREPNLPLQDEAVRASGKRDARD